MYAFEYSRPTSVHEAVELHATTNEAAYLAGGQSLLPMMKSRLAGPDLVIDIRQIEELQGVRIADGRLVIGAGTTHAAAAAATLIAGTIPALAELAGSIADMHVRNLGTLGGSVALNDPAADYPAALLALDGLVATDRRSISAAEFMLGTMTTAIEPGEIVVAVSFRIPASAVYRKFRNPVSGFPVAGVMAARFDDEIRIGVTGVGADGAFRWDEAEAMVRAGDDVAGLEHLGVGGVDVLHDLQASVAYRLHLLRLMAFEALTAL